MSNMDIEINDAGVFVGGVRVPGVLADEVRVVKQSKELCEVQITLLADTVTLKDGSTVHAAD